MQHTTGSPFNCACLCDISARFVYPAKLGDLIAQAGRLHIHQSVYGTLMADLTLHILSPKLMQGVSQASLGAFGQ